MWYIFLVVNLKHKMMSQVDDFVYQLLSFIIGRQSIRIIESDDRWDDRNCIGKLMEDRHWLHNVYLSSEG